MKWTEKSPDRIFNRRDKRRQYESNHFWSCRTCWCFSSFALLCRSALSDCSALSPDFAVFSFFSALKSDLSRSHSGVSRLLHQRISSAPFISLPALSGLMFPKRFARHFCPVRISMPKRTSKARVTGTSSCNALPIARSASLDRVKPRAIASRRDVLLLSFSFFETFAGHSRRLSRLGGASNEQNGRWTWNSGIQLSSSDRMFSRHGSLEALVWF